MTRLLAFNDVETALDDPDLAARLAGLIADRRGGDTLVASAGDVFGPGVLAMATDGEQALAFLRAVDPDVLAVGNHDFDVGVDRLPDRMRAAPGTWLAANVRRDGERFAPDATAPWTVERVDGSTVGVVGVAHPETGEIHGGIGDDVTFGDPVAAVRACLARMPAVDHTVVVSHCGRDDPIAEATDVDAVIGGHYHERRVDRVAGTLLARTAGQASALAEVDLAAEPSVEFHDPVAAPRDEALADDLAEMIAETGYGTTIGHAPTPVGDHEAAARGESLIGNFVTDAFRWGTGADLALLSAGAIREAPPLSGEVTLFDYLRLLPYEQPVLVSAVSGETLRAAVESTVLPDRGEHPLQVSGAEVVWDGDALAALRVGGEPVEPGESFEVATAAYAVVSDGHVPPLTRATVVSEAGPQYELVAAYAREHGIAPSLEGRISHRG